MVRGFSLSLSLVGENKERKNQANYTDTYPEGMFRGMMLLPKLPTLCVSD